MRYIEPIKSWLLIFLVALSLFLTFRIWTYTPDYGVIEEKEVEEIIIGEQTQLSNVIRPYKLVFKGEETWRGTVSTTNIDNVLQSMQNWHLSNVSLVTNQFTPEQLNELVRTQDHVTMIFAEEIPMTLFQEFFKIDLQRMPSISFDRLIIEWNVKAKVARAYFVNVNEQQLYEASITMTAPSLDERVLKEIIMNATEYTEIEREDTTSLYVIKNNVETVHYTYHTGEVSIDKFVRSLFSDYSSINKQVNSAASEQYEGASEKMDVNPLRREFKYVNPRGQDEQLAVAELIRETFRFINATGSFTGDFRYVYGDGYEAKYQLFVQGFPVYSEDSSTTISLSMRDGRPYQYNRPYYTLDIADMKVEALMSGARVINILRKQNPELLEQMNDLVVGYMLRHTENSRIFVLEPSWFVLQGEEYVRIDPLMTGGVASGLE